MPFIALKVHSGGVIKIVQRLQPSVWHNSLLQMYSFLSGGFGPLVAVWLTVKCRDLWRHGSVTCFMFLQSCNKSHCCPVRLAPGPTQCSCSRCLCMCLDAAASFLQTTGLQVHPRSVNKRAAAPLAANMYTVCNCGNKSYTMPAASGETFAINVSQQQAFADQ